METLEIKTLDPELQQRVENIIKNMETQKSAIEDIQRTIIENSAGIMEANTKLKSSVDELTRELEKVKSEKNEKEKEIQRLADALQQTKDELTRTAQDLEKEKAETNRLRQRIQDLEKEVAQLQQDKDDLQNRIDDLESEQTNSAQSAQEKDEELNRLKQELAAKSQELENTKQELSDLRARYQEGEDDIKRLQAEKAQLESEVEQLRQELKTKDESLRNETAKKDELAEALRIAEEDKQQLQAELEKQRSEYFEADKQKNTLDQKMAALKNAVKAQLDRIYQAKVKLIDEPVKELKRVTDEFTANANKARESAGLPPAQQNVPSSAWSRLTSASRSFLDVMGNVGEQTPPSSPTIEKIPPVIGEAEYPPAAVPETETTEEVSKPTKGGLGGTRAQKALERMVRETEERARKEEEVRQRKLQEQQQFGPPRSDGTQSTGPFIIRKGGGGRLLRLPPFY